MTTSSMSSVEASTVRKVAVRLVPFVALMFFINYLDRTAISFAGPNGMNDELGLTAAQFGFASGIFFIGYILLEVPSNLVLHRVGARRWLARIMVSWGVVAALFTWVDGAGTLYVLRFVLGVAEAGFFPGAIVFLCMWVPARHRSRVLALFYLAQPLTTVVGAPLAGLLIAAGDGAWGLAGWRFMFLGVAIPAVVVGVIAWFYLPDRPADARWLDADEKVWLTEALARDAAETAATDSRSGSARHALTNGRVWTLALIIFGFIYGLYALAFFLPTIIAGFETQFGTEFGIGATSLITAVPYLPAAIVLYFWCRDATRRGVRTWHVAGPAVVGGLSIPVALYAGSPTATVAVITVTACAIFAGMPNFWTFPARILHGAAAAAGIALINTVGNTAGFVAPYVTGALADLTGGYEAPMALVGGLMLLSAVLMSVIGRDWAAPAADLPARAADEGTAP